jgi:hypothetical protein
MIHCKAILPLPPAASGTDSAILVLFGSVDPQEIVKIVNAEPTGKAAAATGFCMSG